LPRERRKGGEGRATVAITTQGGPFAGVSAATIKRRALKMLEALAQGDSELSIALVSDKVIHELNLDYRKKDKPTDVLAFAMREGEGGAMGGALGDVIISVETARKQARAHKKTLLEEMTMLLAHGLLHLLGYDHQNDRDERVMNAKTEELVRAAHSFRAGFAA
jgi:probable rRNA maturation factor